MNDYGMVPPQAVDLEEAVLGALMLESDAFNIANKLLSRGVFYKTSHQIIYDAIKSLNDKYEPVDILTVSEELKVMGKLDAIGGPFYITQLTNRVASAAHIAKHCMIIMDKYLKREFIRIGSDINKSAFDETQDVDDCITLMQKNMQSISNIVHGAGMKDKGFTSILDKSLENLKDRMHRFNEGLEIGIPTGLKTLDHHCGGWKDGDLVVIAARPSMGKTAVTLAHILAAAQAEKHVSVYSLEMEDTKLVDRIIVGQADVNAWRYKNGSLNDDEYVRVKETIQDLRKNKYLTIDDRAGCSLAYIRSQSSLLKSKGLLDMIVIDYLQLMNTDESANSSNREREVAVLSRGLKLLAKELGVPVILLAQLNRAVESRPNKQPQLSDLRESGAIEQDADMVIFLNRPERYDIMEDEDGKSTEGVMYYDFAKFRDGGIGIKRIRYNTSLTKFYDHEDELEKLPTETMANIPHPDKKIDSKYNSGLDELGAEFDTNPFH